MVEPGKQAFNFPTATVAAQRAAVLGWGAATADPVGRDKFDAALLMLICTEI